VISKLRSEEGFPEGVAGSRKSEVEVDGFLQKWAPEKAAIFGCPRKLVNGW